MGEVAEFPPLGFGRGAVVRFRDGGENMLVIRSLEESTIAIACEGDEGGKLRMGEYWTRDLIQILPPQMQFEAQAEGVRRAKWRGR